MKQKNKVLLNRKRVTEQAAEDDYFGAATSWADDYYASAVASRQRYRIAFFLSMGLSVMLTIAITSLVPLQHLIPIEVIKYSDGNVTIKPLQNTHAPINRAQTESDLVRYVVNRESYYPDSYEVQYRLVSLLSNAHVQREYAKAQSISNPISPINRLGKKAIKTVHVESILFLDNDATKREPGEVVPHGNLAKIDFTVTLEKQANGASQKIPMTVLVSWIYRGTPQNPDVLWQNWDGFQVARYQLQQRHLTQM